MVSAGFTLVLRTGREFVGAKTPSRKKANGRTIKHFI
jgi:hypothetical protein